MKGLLLIDLIIWIWAMCLILYGHIAPNLTEACIRISLCFWGGVILAIILKAWLKW